MQHLVVEWDRRLLPMVTPLLHRRLQKRLGLDCFRICSKSRNCWERLVQGQRSQAAGWTLGMRSGWWRVCPSVADHCVFIHQGAAICWGGRKRSDVERCYPSDEGDREREAGVGSIFTRLQCECDGTEQERWEMWDWICPQVAGLGKLRYDKTISLEFGNLWHSPLVLSLQMADIELVHRSRPGWYGWLFKSF